MMSMSLYLKLIDMKMLSIYKVNTAMISAVSICINMNKAYDRIDSYLSSQGGIGTSIEILITT